jgi:hypothetical protein
MQTHPIHVADGRELVLEVRSELFAFGDVLDVFATGRPDVLVVVCSGRPRPAQWLAVLRAAGFEIQVRRHAKSGGALRTGRELAGGSARSASVSPTTGTKRARSPLCGRAAA